MYGVKMGVLNLHYHWIHKFHYATIHKLFFVFLNFVFIQTKMCGASFVYGDNFNKDSSLIINNVYKKTHLTFSCSKI